VYIRGPLPYIPGSYHKTTTFVIENTVNGSGSPKIVDIYYEKDLTFIEFCFSRKDVK
jgi:hypothetical protein